MKIFRNAFIGKKLALSLKQLWNSFLELSLQIFIIVNCKRKYALMFRRVFYTLEQDGFWFQALSQELWRWEISAKLPTLDQWLLMATGLAPFYFWHSYFICIKRDNCIFTASVCAFIEAVGQKSTCFAFVALGLCRVPPVLIQGWSSVPETFISNRQVSDFYVDN